MIKIIILFVILSHSILLADSYLTNPTCSTRNYHLLKNEMNLDMAYTPISPYTAEAFVSNHIYNIDKDRDVGEEFQFGKNNVVRLLMYEQDISSGFEAGLYEVDNNRLIIAFGGTTSKEKYSVSSTKEDIYTDSILLSERTTSYQVNAAAIFLQKIQVAYPERDITATGHSLGGGLAQFASLMSKQYSSYKKIKAITFNTAPMPLTNITKTWVENLDASLLWAETNNVNFMVDNDPLTNILKSAEAYSGNDLHSFIIDTGVDTLNYFLNQTPKGRDFKNLVFSLAQIYMHQTVRDLKKLIYGKRVVLNTNTGHSMLSLLKAVYTNYDNYENFRNAFDDVPQGSRGNCNVMYLMQHHIISYPKSERQYKYYPNNNATNYEIAIYLVNSFLYTQYRNALANNSNLTKFSYFNQKIVNVPGMTQDLIENDLMTFELFTNIMQEIYKEKILSDNAYNMIHTSDKAAVLSTSLNKLKTSVFGFSRFKNQSLVTPITRLQMTNWIVDSLKINYEKLIQSALNQVADAKISKTAAGSLVVPSKSYFIYESIPNYTFQYQGE